MGETSESPKHAKWWHTMLTTPALLLALGGGLGTAVPAIWGEWKSWRLGIESNRIQIVQEQLQQEQGKAPEPEYHEVLDGVA